MRCRWVVHVGSVACWNRPLTRCCPRGWCGAMSRLRSPMYAGARTARAEGAPVVLAAACSYGDLGGGPRCSAAVEREPTPEVLGSLLHGDEPNAVVAAPIIDEAFQHEQDLGPAGHSGGQGLRETPVSYRAVRPGNSLPPQLRDVPWVDEPLA